jgi:hypothetical protein
MITKEDTRSDDGRIARDAAVSVQLEEEAASLADTAEEEQEEPSPETSRLRFWRPDSNP